VELSIYLLLDEMAMGWQGANHVDDEFDQSLTEVQECAIIYPLLSLSRSGSGGKGGAGV
jgi:hypothetical protein